MQEILILLDKTPFRVVIINVVLSLLLLFCVLIYKILFPNKNTNYIALLLVVSLLPTVSIFRSGSYESGDLTINAAKLMSFYANLQEGNIIPRWSGELNATFGYPNFVFAYPLPYYIASLFHYIGLSFIGSIKALLFFSYVGSGYVMFAWLKQKMENRFAFLGSVLYLFAPYHLVDLHFRVDIGETLAFLFMPLTLLLADFAAKNGHFFWKFATALSLAFLILSHQAVSLLFFPLVITYLIFSYTTERRRSYLSTLLISVPLALLFSLYYWLPVLIESKFTQQVNSLKNTIHFPQFWELIYSPYRYGLLFQGPNGELSPVVGYANLIVILVSIFVLLKNLKNFKVMFFLIASLLYIFLITPYSSPIWSNLPLLRQIEFPFRGLSIVIFTVATLGAFVMSKSKSNFVIFTLTLIAMATSILNWGNRRNVSGITDEYITMRLPLLTSEGEGLFPAAPIYVNPKKVWQSKIPFNQIEMIDSQFNLIDEKRSITSHKYILDVTKPGIVKENTYYFPGWELKINGVPKEIEYQNANFQGIITFEVEKGKQNINLTFSDTPVRFYSLVISLLSLLFAGLLLVF